MKTTFQKPCLIVAALALLAGCAGPSQDLASSRAASQIGNDKRMAVVYECFYALRQSWLNPPNQWGPYDSPKIGYDVAGNWAYLSSDVDGYNHIKSKFDRYYHSDDETSDMTSPNYAVRGGWGRGGQCLFFVNLILWRSVHYDLPKSWASYSTSRPSARNAQAGDVVFKKGSPNHIAIVVVKDSSGMDVVDSNFEGYGSKRPQYHIIPSSISSEIIGRHYYNNATIDSQGWKVYSGAGLWY